MPTNGKDSMRIALHSVYREERHDAPSRIEFLRECAAQDMARLHQFVEVGPDVDAILITEAWRHADSAFYGRIRRSDVVRRYQGRVFVYCDADVPNAPFAGFFPSLTPRTADPGFRVSSPYITPLMRRFEGVAGREPSRLYGFRGSAATHRCRRALQAVVDSRGAYEDVTSKWSAAGEESRRDLERAYLDSILDVKFVLCPRGRGSSSYRVFETMALGRVPVIISDIWVEPPGPDWSACSVRVPQAQIQRIPRLLAEMEHQWPQLARNAAREYHQHFSTHSIFNWLGNQMESMLEVRERAGRNVFSAATAWAVAIGDEARGAARRCLLATRS